jgi:transcriptional regulator with XRE-family HTH domain
MAGTIETAELMQRIQMAKSVTKMLREIDKVSELPTIGAYLNEIRKEKGLKKEKLFAAVGISTVYGYEILSEKKIPSRDTLLQFAFAFKMNVDETQKLLKIGEKAQLYPKLKRDAHIIFALSNGLSMVELNILAVNTGILPIGNY